MIQLDISREDRDVLIVTLERAISEFRMEIANTDRLDFRNHLKKQKRVLINVLAVLREHELID